MQSAKGKNEHYWLKSGFLILLQNMSNILFGFGGFYLLVRILDKHAFGAWTLFISTTIMIETARSGLIQNGLIRYVSHSPLEDHAHILVASATMSAVITLCCVILNVSMAGYLSSVWHSPELALLFYVYSVAYVLSGILSQFQWIEQANLSFLGIFITTFIRQSLFFFFVLGCYFLHFNVHLIYLVYVQILSLVASIVVQFFFVRKYLAFTYQVSIAWINKLFHYGKYVFGTSISGLLSGTIGQMMLGALLSPAAAGAYNVAVRIMNLVDIPTNTVAIMVFPQSAKREASGGNAAIKYLYEKSVGTILALVIPCFLFLLLFPNFVVHFIAGSKYPETIPIVKVTVFYCFFIPFGRQFGTILDSIGKPKINFLIIVLSAVLNILLNFVLIKQFGVMGAVYATLVTASVIFVIMQYYLRRNFDIKTANTFIYAARFYPEFSAKYIWPLFRKAAQLVRR